MTFDRALGPLGPFGAATFLTAVAPRVRTTAGITLPGGAGSARVRIATAINVAWGGPPRVQYNASQQTIVGASGLPAESFTDFPCTLIP